MPIRLRLVIFVILSAAKDLTERSGTGGTAGVRSFAALRTTLKNLYWKLTRKRKPLPAIEPMPYAELQVTTNYSFLRGGSHPGELVYQATNLGHYAIGIAEAIVAEELLLDSFDSMPDDEVLDAIVALRGLGRWSAEMFLIFDLGRPDVFSGGDLGLRRGIQIAYELDEMPTPDEAIAIAERWSPHRSLACLYLWEAVHANPR